MTPMKQTTLLLSMLLATALPVLADSKATQLGTNLANQAGLPGAGLAATVSIDATVKEIDYKTRKVTLTQSDGSDFTLQVGKEARNFDQVKKGDKVHMEYFEALAVDVERDNGQLSMGTETTLARSPKGQLPAGILTETTTLTAEVTSIDKTNRKVTLKGPEGNSVTLKVAKDAKHFSEIKTGDRVVAVYTQALAIAVTKS